MGYRAPELLLEYKYNSKVDIWALGCIFFELCTGTKAFASDGAVMEYRNNRPLQLPVFCGTTLPPNIFISSQPTLLELGDRLSEMLSPEPEMRPSAKDLQKAPQSALCSVGT